MERLTINNEHYFIENADAFAYFLKEKLGQDAADLFAKFQNEPVERGICPMAGDCEYVYREQEHWQRICQDARDDVDEVLALVEAPRIKKDEVRKRLREIRHNLNSEL